MGGGCQYFLHPCRIGNHIRLAAGPADRCPLGEIQAAVLKAGRIGSLPHFPTQGVDFADQVALADPADRGVTAHLADMIRLEGDKKRGPPHPCGCQGRFNPGVTAAYYNDVIRFHRILGIRSP